MSLYLKTKCIACGAETEIDLWFTTAITQEKRRCHCGQVHSAIRVEIRPDPVSVKEAKGQRTA